MSLRQPLLVPEATGLATAAKSRPPRLNGWAWASVDSDLARLEAPRLLHPRRRKMLAGSVLSVQSRQLKVGFAHLPLYFFSFKLHADTLQMTVNVTRDPSLATRKVFPRMSISERDHLIPMLKRRPRHGFRASREPLRSPPMLISAALRMKSPWMIMGTSRLLPRTSSASSGSPPVTI